MITPDDLVDLVIDLRATALDEPRIRCAIGRAYYAAYHYCLHAANNWCGPLALYERVNKGTHEQLYLRLQGHSKFASLDTDLRTIAEHAKKLRNLRVTCDYHLERDVNTKDLDRGVQYMRRVQIGFEQIRTKAPFINKGINLISNSV